MDVDGALHTTLESASFSRRPVRELYFRQCAEQPDTWESSSAKEAAQ
ncbi:hypothetical protein C4K04_1280 [Pseudomonas chlororaphis]|uniref:Uncharacterized protein n=1 Tax=Pseudomonas chlororaphis TaxID=587753 RepID=A0A3G7TKS9_9PSED|nr:hypothetical protein C4K04_1280 [Pseudomonas chlororaphis]